MSVIFAHVTIAEPEALCTSVQICQRLLDTPTNILDAVVYAEIVAVTDIAVEALRERGYGGIWAVGKGTQYPPHLTTLHYENPRAAKGAKNIALVEKGIVYDCGGLALKQKMDGAKGDCGGSSALLGAFIAVVRVAKANPAAYAHVHHLSVTLCLVANAIGPNAYRNDDSVIMKSGKAVEVENTDADGRVVLGDGVYCATHEQPFTPAVVVDAAALTGARYITCGTHHAGVYANSAQAEAAIMASGLATGDVCSALLYAPEYHMKQYTTVCGGSCGGWFIEPRVSPRFKGPYVDPVIAGTAGRYRFRCGPGGGQHQQVQLVVERSWMTRTLFSFFFFCDPLVWSIIPRWIDMWRGSFPLTRVAHFFFPLSTSGVLLDSCRSFFVVVVSF